MRHPQQSEASQWRQRWRDRHEVELEFDEMVARRRRVAEAVAAHSRKQSTPEPPADAKETT